MSACRVCTDHAQASQWRHCERPRHGPRRHRRQQPAWTSHAVHATRATHATRAARAAPGTTHRATPDGSRAPTPAPALPPASGPVAPQERDEQAYPYLWLFVLLLFVLTALFKTVAGEHAMLGSIALGGLMIAWVVWFIACFTGDAARRVKDMFVFAYAFTFGSFGTLLLPFVTEHSIDQVASARPAALELVRGCVRAGAKGGLGDVSAVVMCPYDVPPVRDASPVAAAAAAKPGDAHHVWPAGEVEAVRFTLLLAIGGVAATVSDWSPPDKPGTAKPAAGTACGAGQPLGSCDGAARRPHVEVVGGLAVPFFVLVLAFIGGAVSLSRRVPAYQRRLHVNYVGSVEEYSLQPFQAREMVVFQIMQLISAPFLAIATWYIVSPMGLPSAATLAFGTGFASEPLLLMIRGLVMGIRPQVVVTKLPPALAAPPGAPTPATVPAPALAPAPGTADAAPLSPQPPAAAPPADAPQRDAPQRDAPQPDAPQAAESAHAAEPPAEPAAAPPPAAGTTG